MSGLSPSLDVFRKSVVTNGTWVIFYVNRTLNAAPRDVTSILQCGIWGAINDNALLC